MIEMVNFRASGRVSNSKKGRHRAPLTRKRDLFLAFAIVSLPLLAIASILIGFVFNASERQKPNLSVGTSDLPVVYLDNTTAYYTGIRPGSFLLVGSWASNIAELVVAPFMVIFSYTVAREVLQASGKDGATSDLRPSSLREILRGAHVGTVGLWHWGRHLISKRKELDHQQLSEFRAVNVAGSGLLTASLLTILVIIGDNWLHATTYATQIRHYEDVKNFSDLLTEFPDNLDPPSFSPIDGCSETLASDDSSKPLPCSLNTTSGVTNVANPRFAYQTLGQGLSQVNSSFNRINFTSLDDAEFNGEGTPYQIVTTFQGGAWHSIFFNPDSAEEYDGTKSGFGPDVGIDYIAMTTSMTTQCTMATKDCNIDASNSNLTFDQNNISIPFHCYDGFSGDLGQTPATGHERAQGWNMSFYDVTDGSPRNILTQAQSNPFRFYVAAAVNSIDFQDLRDANYPATVDGSLVYVGGGFSAFALNCNATIYNVTFSLNNGSFYSFNTKQSFPQIASIIKAPLQVGFGQYHLYEAAKVAVLPNDRSIADTMGTAFSQTGMALASGAFDFNNTALARLRWTVTVTKVPKAPYWFLVMACLMYSVFGFIMTVVALFLRRMPAIQDQQARLMDQWAPAIKSALDEDEKEGTEGSRFLD